MKIAYLILTHTDPEFLARVSHKLTNHTDNEVYVHVDQKADVSPFKQAVKGQDHTHIYEPRIPVFWGV